MYSSGNILQVLNVLGSSGSIITFRDSTPDNSYLIAGKGRITITSTKSGQAVTAVYYNPIGLNVTIQSDANSTITIRGSLSLFNAYNTSTITFFSTRNQKDLAILYVRSSSCTSFHLTNCPKLQDLDITGTSALTDIEISDVPKISTIHVGTSTQEAADVVISLITEYADNHGTVIAMALDPYYTDLQTAATAAGWTLI